MKVISINEEKCIGCSLCVRDCPNAHLYLENSKAHTRDGGCMECGHCYAICPQNAVSMEGYTCAEETATPMTQIDSETLLTAMKSRRSVRHFDARPVENEKIQMILEAGRYCPTGGNAQNVAYTILGSKQKSAEELCVKLFRKGQKIGSLFVPLLRRFEITDDFFFKGAPLVVAISGKNEVNASLAAAYMELMAESLGLGVLYSGFFKVCARFSKKLRKLLKLPDGHKVVTCLVIGYPDVKYQRIPPRKDLQVKYL
jgi:nitroreductase/NAD-dependent dihydropyrimidine dehydrogenase PreA subunit